MPGTLRIGKIAGIDIEVHVSWIIILVLLTVSLATGWFPQFYAGWSIPTYWFITCGSTLEEVVVTFLGEALSRYEALRKRSGLSPL